jgi:hypothetical protein
MFYITKQVTAKREPNLRSDMVQKYPLFIGNKYKKEEDVVMWQCTEASRLCQGSEGEV